MRFVKNIIEKYDVATILLCLIAATIPFRINVGNAAIILASAYTLFFFQKDNFKKLKSFSAVFPIAFFFIVIISSFLSNKYMLGLKRLNLEVLLILLVFILVNNKINKTKIIKILIWFTYATVLSVSILLINNLIKIAQNKGLEELIFHNFTLLYDYHPIYYSLNISLALFFIINTKTNWFYKKSQIIKIGFIVVLLLGLIFCVSKAILFINGIIYVLYFSFKIKHLKKRIAYFTILAMLWIGVFNIKFIKERFIDGLRFSPEISSFQPTNDFSQKKIFTYEEKTEISDLELRYVLSSIGVYHLVKDNKLLLGYKQGDTKDYLNYYFFSYNLGPNWYEDFNLHNQYTHILVTYGILVLLFFLSYLFFSFYAAIKHKDTLHVFFLILVCFGFLFEVNLVRSKGIVFFYFFNTLFLQNYLNFESSNNRN
ncbi:hypothetical protein [Lacinutrix sp. MEBiC02404]